MKKINNIVNNYSLPSVKKYEEDFDRDLKLKFTVKKIAFKIFYELKKRKMSQKDLANILDVTPQNINKFLKGDDYKISTLVKIEDALSINIIDRDIYKPNEPSVIIKVKILEDRKRALHLRTPLNEINWVFKNSDDFITKQSFTELTFIEGI